MEQLKLVIQTPEPVRLCEYLRRRIGVSARLLARLKRTPAGILCNGVPVRAVDPVRAGDVVVLTMPEQEGLEPNPALYVPSVLETAYYIVYDKLRACRCIPLPGIGGIRWAITLPPVCRGILSGR